MAKYEISTLRRCVNLSPDLMKIGDDFANPRELFNQRVPIFTAAAAHLFRKIGLNLRLKWTRNAIVQMFQLKLRGLVDVGSELFLSCLEPLIFRLDVCAQCRALWDRWASPAGPVRSTLHNKTQLSCDFAMETSAARAGGLFNTTFSLLSPLSPDLLTAEAAEGGLDSFYQMAPMKYDWALDEYWLIRIMKLFYKLHGFSGRGESVGMHFANDWMMVKKRIMAKRKSFSKSKRKTEVRSKTIFSHLQQLRKIL